MPREARKKSESGYYHIVLRGIGKQILFEDDEDNERFLSTVQRYRRELGFELVAWCLMENHAHLLIRDGHDRLEQIMKKIAGSYAYYFNHKYDRVGHLYQDRFKSEAVEDDAYLLTVIRYIHNNPQKAGLAPAGQYRWSSYGAYLKPFEAVDNAHALELIGGSQRFARFMSGGKDERCLEVEERRATGDGEAKETICNVCGVSSGTELQRWDRKERNEALRLLKQKGLSIRQLERLTGINRGAIQRA